MVGAALESMGAPPAIKPRGHGQASCVELLCNLRFATPRLTRSPAPLRLRGDTATIGSRQLK
jgi:hypothetical protein